MDTLLRDLRFGYRNLLRNPGFTAVAILSLAIGIGANTAIFSFINTMLLKKLPVSDPDSLVVFGTGVSRGTSRGAPASATDLFSWSNYQRFQAATSVFQDLAALDSFPQRLYASFAPGSDSDREEVSVTPVSGNYMAMLGARPAAGRFFDRSVDAAPGNSALAVFSYAFWTRRFHRDPTIVGSTIRMGNREYTVLGVAGPGFFGTRVGETPDMWIPLAMKPTLPLSDPDILDNHLVRFMQLIGRLKPGVTLRQANANVGVVFRQMVTDDVQHPGKNGAIDAEDLALSKTAYVELNSAARGLSGLRTRYSDALKVLMVVVVLVLVIACANVANLLVAMGARRQREIAVRMAIGAGRRRVISQVITEGMLLSAAAGFLGILVATGLSRVLVHLISTGPRDLPLAFDLDPAVLFFTIGVSAATGIFFSLAPAIRAASVDLNSSLKEGKALMATPGRIAFGRAMVVGQVALSLTLLVGSGLLVKSFRNLLTTGTGFERQGVLVFKVDSEYAGYRPDVRLAGLYSRIGERLRSLPGVAAAAVSARLFHEGRQTESFTSPGLNLAQNERHIRQLNFVSPDFFTTLRIPILAGRVFDSRDVPGSPYVAVVGSNFARQVFGDSSPIGRIIRMAPLEETRDYMIVGVARDIKYLDVREEPEKQVYLPLAQNVVFARNIVVRVSGEQQQTASAVRSALRTLEPNLPVRWTTTLADEVSDSLVVEHAVAQLASFFALLALLLSAIGLFGSISFAVSRRTSEIGIRIALGAERSGVVGMVFRDTATLLLWGVLAGLPLVLLAGKLIRTLLYGVSDSDPMILLGAVLLLVATAAVAGYLPARRAASVDPTVALRCE